MSGPAAVHRLEDPFGFARAAGTYRGQFAIAAMPRLQDRLAGDAGAVSCVVRGGQDRRQRSWLELEIAGTPSLRCDRCLTPLDYPLKLHSRVLLAHPGEVLPDDDEPESPEWIEAGQELDLLELVEDEILLGLPLSIRHDPGKCSSDGAGTGRKDGSDTPFSGLAALLDQKQANTD